MNVATGGHAAVAGVRSPGRLPWPPLLGATAIAATTVGLAIATGGGAAALAMLVAGLALAASAGYLLDDAAHALTQTLPCALWRRRSSVVVRGIAVLAGTWAVLLAWLAWRGTPIAAASLTLQTSTITLLALAAAALLGRHGEPEPGSLVAPAVALIGIGALLAQPILGFTVFQSSSDESTGRIRCWVGVGIVALVTLLVALRDPVARPSLNSTTPAR